MQHRHLSDHVNWKQAAIDNIHIKRMSFVDTHNFTEVT